MVDAKKSIPEWQRQSAPVPTETDHGTAEHPASESQPAPSGSSEREVLLQQARAFLAHDEIRDGTTESKTSFLKEKGLQDEEIRELLGTSRTDSSAPEPATDVVSQESHEQSASSPLVSPQSTPAPSSTSTEPASNTAPPPIITYPEFLLHATKPPPLITPTRALNSVYAASLLGGAIYGASKFILQPMFETLSEARHDLFETTKTQLNVLDARLEGVVSIVPPTPAVGAAGHKRYQGRADGEEQEDVESTASDPTEMFHRDMGVQTSGLSSSGSSVSSDNDDDGGGEEPRSSAADKLSTLHNHLVAVLQASKSSATAAEEVHGAVRATQSFLDDLRYAGGGAGYGSLGGDDAWRTQVFGSKFAGAGTSGKKSDAIEDFRQEIRGMKGTLLSARNFPRGALR